MSKLPRISSRHVVKVLLRLGFRLRSQSGSHAVYVHPDGRKTTVPIHNTADIGIGLLTKIIKKDLQMSKEDFLRLLRKGQVN